MVISKNEPSPHRSVRAFLPLFVFLLLVATQAYLIEFGQEDLMHLVPDTREESVHFAAMSYFKWNARIGELASYFIGDYYKIWIMLLHPFFMTLAVVSINRIATGEWIGKGSCHTMLFIMVSILALFTGNTWFLGNLNWLYPSSSALFFAAATSQIYSGRFQFSWKKTFLLFPVAIIVGMSNENTSIVSLLFFAGGGFFWKRKANIRWGVPYLTLLATLFISALVFYTAPAGLVRSAASGWEISFRNIFFNSLLSIPNWLYFIICFWRFLLIGIVLVVWKSRLNTQLRNSKMLLLVVAFITMWGVLIATPLWGAPRGYCPMELITVCILASIFHLKQKSASRPSRALMLAVHILLMLTVLYPRTILLWRQHQLWTQMEAMAYNSRLAGQDTLVITGDDIDFKQKPVSPLWKLPDFIYPYKQSTHPLLIPHTESEIQCYFADPLWQEAPLNRSVAKRLGLKELKYIPAP